MKHHSEKEDSLYKQAMQILYEESGNGIVIFQKDNADKFICQSCNSVFCSILEKSQTELVGSDFQVIFDQKVFSQLKQVFFNLVEYRTGFPVFVSLKNKRYQIVSRLIHDDERTQGLVLSFSEHWRNSPGFYGNQVLLDTLLDGIFIFDVGGDGKFYLNFLNISHMNSTGLDIKTDVGKTPYELVDAESAKNVIRRYQQCVDTRKSLTYEEELTFTGDGGTSWWETKISPVTIDGEVKQIIGSARDITILKQSMQKVQALYVEYEALFNETSIAIWLEDVGDDQDVNSIRVKRYNPFLEQSYQMKTRDYAGKKIDDIFPGPQASLIKEKYAELLRIREPMKFEIELTINGKDIVNLTTLSPVIRDGKIINIIGSSLDISEIRRYQELLKIEGEMLADHVSQQKQVLQTSFDNRDDFLTSITETFHGPLVSILGITEIVMLSTAQDDSRTLYLEQVKQQSEQLLNLIDGILQENQSMAEEVLRIHSFDLKKGIERLISTSLVEDPSLVGRIIFNDQIPMDTIWQDEHRVIRVVQYILHRGIEKLFGSENLILEGIYLPDERIIQLAGRIDLSSDRYDELEEEVYLKRYDQKIAEEIHNGIDVRLIQLLVGKIGANLSYRREKNTVRVIFLIPLVHPTE